jgi:hypothetical protein
MTFTPKDWRNDPDISTPLSAEAMEDLETRLGDFADKSGAAYGTSAAPTWNASTSYGLRSWVKGSDGRGYFSLVDANVGNDPTQDDGTHWSSLFGPNPMLNQGDMIIGDVGGVPIALDKGSPNSVLTMLDANSIGWAPPYSVQTIEVGQVTVTVPGGSNDATVTVNHSFGVAPGAVMAISAENWSCSAPPANFTTTNFQLKVWQAQGGTGGGSVVVQWSAYHPSLTVSSSAGTGTKAKVGATVNPVGAPTPADWTLAQQFDSNVGRSMATVLQKVYLKPGELPTNPKSEWVTFMNTHGGKLLISFKADREPFTTATDNAFATLIGNCYGTLGPNNWKAVLWQEANTNKNFGPGQAAEYHRYVNHYGPIFQGQRARNQACLRHGTRWPYRCGQCPKRSGFLPRRYLHRRSLCRLLWRNVIRLHGARLDTVARSSLIIIQEVPFRSA